MVISVIMNNTTKESDKASSVKTVDSLAEFIAWINIIGKENMLFRGMANAEWKLESSLHRRLKHNKLKNIHHDTYHDIFVEMVKILISRSRRDGYDIENGRELKDLELLAKLQHYGVATCMIDFTKNSLVALYFACLDDEYDNKANGKVVAFNNDNADFYDEIYIKNSDKKIEYWLKEYKKNKRPWILSPKKLSNRITAQQSVFVFGSPILSTENTENFHICKITNKKEIVKQLKKYGISEETLFNDFIGFSQQNSCNKDYENWDTDSYLMSGVICYVIGDYESAIQYNNKAIKSNNEACKKHNAHGNEQKERGNSQEANKYYDEVARLNNETYKAYNIRGNALGYSNNNKEAIEDYDKAIELNPKNPRAYSNRGVAKCNMGKSKDAIKDYDKAIELDPEYIDAYNNRGVTLNKLSKYENAIKDYDKAIELDPEDHEVYTNRGATLSDMGKNKDAIKDYDKAIELNPKYHEAYYNRGIAKNKLGNTEGAEADSAKAKEIELESKGSLSDN